MKKGSKGNVISNMKILTKTLLPLLILLALTLVNGVNGVNNSRIIMNASEEITNVHFANVYYLEQLAGNFERLQKIVYAHCVSNTDMVKRI